MFLSRGDRDLGLAFQTHPGRQAFISSGSKEPRSALESRSEEHTSELQSPKDLVCRLLLEKKIKAITFFFFNDTATTEIYTLSLHDALPISHPGRQAFISSGSKEPRSALESRRVSLGAPWVDSRESSLLRRLERGRERAGVARLSWRVSGR